MTTEDTTESERLPIRWQELLDVYQGPGSPDPLITALMRLDTGEVTCQAMLCAREGLRLRSRELLVSVPTKNARRSWEQRARFADSLCDEQLARHLREALDGPEPFQAFERALGRSPIEAFRFVEEERREDLLHLCRWLERCGVRPEAPPDAQVSVIEFPRHRVRPPGE